MISRDPEDRRGVISKGIIKLVVVVGRFPEVVDHVPEVKQKRGAVGIVGVMPVRGQLIGNRNFMAVFLFVRRPCISDRMKDDFSSALYSLNDLGSVWPQGILKCVQIGGLAARFLEADHILFQQISDLLVHLRVRRMLGFESRGIWRGIALAENRLGKRNHFTSGHKDYSFSRFACQLCLSSRKYRRMIVGTRDSGFKAYSV